MNQVLARMPGEENTQREVKSACAELLTTKCFVPVSPNALIPRPRLSALLDAGVGRPLTLISAPAGFGKTTLLSTWAGSHTNDDAHVAWVTLDEGDNAPRRFWAYILLAFERCERGTSEQALQVLHAPEKPPFEEVLTALINRLAGATTSWALILDDYQVISEPAIHSQLSYLLEHLPPQVRVMLATRSDPPLPLSRLRARGQVLEVRTEQLRATEIEVAALLHQMMGLTLEDNLLQEIIDRTEGWLAGLRLVGLALQGCPDPACRVEGTRGSDRYILDYVSEEVLRQQEPTVYRFLLRTSILSQLTASLCDAVLEQADSQRVLEELERTNVFVVPLDRQRRWYRYHTLFAEAMRARLGWEVGEDVRPLHLRASRWYEQEGNTAEAVGHALSARAWERAADLIESMPQAFSRGTPEGQALTRWLEQLPAEVVRSRPGLSPLSIGVPACAGKPSTGRLDPQVSAAGRGAQTEAHTAKGTGSGTRDEREPPLLAGRPGYTKADLELLLLDPLTEREREVMRLVARGASNSEIAQALVVEVNTVKRHMGNIMSKLQAGNRTQAVAQARALGLLADVA